MNRETLMTQHTHTVGDVFLTPETEPSSPTAAPGAPAIYRALAGAMRDVAAVGKDGWNPEQRFKFRSIDDVMTAAHHALAANGVVLAPTVLRREVDVRQTKSGGRLNVVTLEVRFRFYAVDGSHLDVTLWGEGADTADKATNKALSAALKYCLLQTLMIPADDMADGDAEHPEGAPGVVPAGPGEPSPPAPPRPRSGDPAWIRDMRARITSATSPDQLAALWREIGPALTAGRIVRDDADRLADEIRARRAVLDRPTSPPPPAEPEPAPVREVDDGWPDTGVEMPLALDEPPADQVRADQDAAAETPPPPPVEPEPVDQDAQLAALRARAERIAARHSAENRSAR